MTMVPPGVHLRKASEFPPIPYLHAEVTLIHMVPEPLRVRQATTVETKINMLAEVLKDSGFVLACWPHDHRQDIYLVDDPEGVMNQIWHKT